MFDKNPSANANNFGANSNPSVPTPPPVSPGPTNSQIMEGSGVEDIFSPVSSGERSNLTGNPINADNSMEQKIPGDKITETGSMVDRRILEERNTAKNNKGGKKLLVLFLVIIVVAAAGAGAWYYMDNFMASDEIIKEDNTINETVSEINDVNSGQGANTQRNADINIPDKNIDVNIDENVNPVAQIDVDKDSDSDGLTDEEEGALKTNPYLADTDRDGLTDKEEISIYGTSPLNPDTDGDGYNDGMEVKSGYNPNGSGVLGEIQAKTINQ